MITGPDYKQKLIWDLVKHMGLKFRWHNLSAHTHCLLCGADFKPDVGVVIADPEWQILCDGCALKFRPHQQAKIDLWRAFAGWDGMASNAPEPESLKQFFGVEVR
jgi:hypothetical protein